MDFPTSEYEYRLTRVQAFMHEEGVDALLLMTEAEVRYFSGFRTLFWQSPTRPWFLVIPANGKPIAIVPEIGASLMGKTWLDDIRTFASPNDSDEGLSLLTDVLRGRSRIGLPMGRESSLRMPLTDFQGLQATLPHASWIDASGLLCKIRMVKSEAEIEKLRRICRIASSSFENAPTLFHEGMPLKDVFKRFRIDLLSEGADDVPYLVGGADEDGYDDVISPPDDRPLRKGDVLMLDTGATLDGYFCDFDRNFSIGPASDLVQEGYGRLYAATEAALAIARPGTTCSALFQEMALVLETTGSGVGRFGHSLGSQLTESPSLIHFDHTLLEPGMVITLEPSLTLPNGKVLVTEEDIVIREGEPELLTRRAPREIPILN